MTNTAGKLFGANGQGGHQIGFTTSRAPQCSMDSSKFGRSMLEKKQQLQDRSPQ